MSSSMVEGGRSKQHEERIAPSTQIIRSDDEESFLVFLVEANSHID
jgi:hypothetical protein